MSKLTITGLVFISLAILLLGYQAVLALMGSDKMGSDLVWTNVSPSDFLGQTAFSLINGVPSSELQSMIWFLVELPLFEWLLAVACLLFSIQAFRGAKA
jgi:hypothetical protein